MRFEWKKIDKMDWSEENIIFILEVLGGNFLNECKGNFLLGENFAWAPFPKDVRTFLQIFLCLVIFKSKLTNCEKTYGILTLIQDV